MQYLVLDLGGELLTSFKVSYHPCDIFKLIFVYGRKKGFENSCYAFIKIQLYLKQGTGDDSRC